MMATDYSPEELAHMQERQARQAAVNGAQAEQAAITAPNAPPATSIPSQPAPRVQSSTPSVTANVATVSQPSAAPINYGPMVNNVVGTYKQIKQEAPSVVESLDTSMPWLKYVPPAIVTALFANKMLGDNGIGGGGGGSGGGGGKPPGIKDRSFTRIDPQMDVSIKQPDGRIEPTLDVVEQNMGQRVTEPINGLAQTEKPNLPVGVTAETEVGKAPKDIGLVERSEQNKLSKEVSAAAPKGSAPAPITTQPVAPNKKKSLPEIKLLDTPQEWHRLTKEGSTFLPGYGAGDNNLFNTYGAEGRKAVLERFNGGKPIGSYDNYLALNEKLKKGVPSSEVPGLMSRLPSEAEAGNYGPLGKKAIIKGAGIGGLLLAGHQLANAKTPTEAALRAVDIGTDYVPILGQIKQGLSPFELESGKLTAKQLDAYKEAQKLGSPYRSVPPPR